MEKITENIKVRIEYIKEMGLTEDKMIDFIEYKNERSNIKMKVPSDLTVHRWYVGLKIPPLDTLIAIAEYLKSNVSYLLSLTDISRANDSYIVNFNLREKRHAAGITMTRLAEISGLSYPAISNYEKKGLEQQNLNVLLSLSSALGCSLDYLLGLSEYKNWEEIRKGVTMFDGIRPGEAFRIETPIIDTTVLMSADGNSLVFSDGTVKPVHDESFKNASLSKIFIENKNMTPAKKELLETVNDLDDSAIRRFMAYLKLSNEGK